MSDNDQNALNRSELDRFELDRARLEIVASYPSVVEAGFAVHLLDEAGIKAKTAQEAAATCLSHVGSAIGGVHVLVLATDYEAAREALTSDNSSEGEVQHLTADENGADGIHNQTEEESSLGDYPKLDKALRAAIFGIVIIPPLLNIYSAYLIVKYRLWKLENGGFTIRFYVALLLNLLGTIIGNIAFGFPSLNALDWMSYTLEYFSMYGEHKP